MKHAALILACLSAPAVAADVVPLAHGTYVGVGTPCADPPFAVMRSYDGRGFPDPHSRDCRAKVVTRQGATYVVANDCINAGVGPAPRSTERMTIHVVSRTRYTDLTGGSDFRLCPPASLPPELRRRATR